MIRRRRSLFAQDHQPARSDGRFNKRTNFVDFRSEGRDAAEYNCYKTVI
jgi:hypothetical protein